MGNYRNLEKEFVERTLLLNAQYESDMYKYDFKDQLNYTLLINSLLGLIVLPKERTISHIPNDRLIKEIREMMGLNESIINEEILTIRELIIAMRHSIAHFDIKIESVSDEFLVDYIVFKDVQKGENYEVIKFKSNELLPFIRYYGGWLIGNIELYGNGND